MSTDNILLFFGGLLPIGYLSLWIFLDEYRYHHDKMTNPLIAFIGLVISLCLGFFLSEMNIVLFKTENYIIYNAIFIYLIFLLSLVTASKKNLKVRFFLEAYVFSECDIHQDFFRLRAWNNYLGFFKETPKLKEIDRSYLRGKEYNIIYYPDQLNHSSYYILEQEKAEIFIVPGEEAEIIYQIIFDIKHEFFKKESEDEFECMLDIFQKRKELLKKYL